VWIIYGTRTFLPIGFRHILLRSRELFSRRLFQSEGIYRYISCLPCTVFLLSFCFLFLHRMEYRTCFWSPLLFSDFLFPLFFVRIDVLSAMGVAPFHWRKDSACLGSLRTLFQLFYFSGSFFFRTNRLSWPDEKCYLMTLALSFFHPYGLGRYFPGVRFLWVSPHFFFSDDG